MDYHGIGIPNNWTDIKWVETLEGCFTLKVTYDKPPTDDEVTRKAICELARQALEKFDGQPVEKYHGN